MDREEAKALVKNSLEEYLRTKGINPRRPFRCLNPEHQDKKPSMSVNRKGKYPHCKCFSCEAYYDTFDLIRIDYGLTEDRDVFNKAYEIFNIEIDRNHYPARTERKEYSSMNNTQPIIHNTQSTIHNEGQQEYKLDLTPEMEAAHQSIQKNIGALLHIKKRGISPQIIEAYKIGYDKEGYNSFLKAYPAHQTKGQKAELYRIFFPYFDEKGRCYYVLSEINDRKEIDDHNGKYRKINRGETNLEAPIFNERYLKKDTPPVVFITEGIYDALSVETVGGKALALVGVGHTRLLSLCEQYRPDTTFILSLDADDAGRASTEKIKAGLDELGIKYLVKTPEGGKDFNDCLVADAGGFRQYIAGIVEEVQNAELFEYRKTAAGSYLSDFFEQIEAESEAPFFPTGFRDVDDILDGGLYSGLYIVGAISSLGKTTFALQVCDHIAEQGKDVLIFSLEISRKELMAKSISRHSMIVSERDEGSTQYAKTLRGVTNGVRYKNYSKKERETLDMAAIEYAGYADRVYIHEGIGDIGVMQVRAAVEKHIRLTGNRPVVLVDYVQILSPYNDRGSDKQNTDKSILELKRMSRDLNIPIVGISSFNRESYIEPVTMAAFKESGAVEYGSDVLIALQYYGMDYEDGEAKDKRSKRVRTLLSEQITKARNGEAQTIQVKVLKNRNGTKGDALLSFYPMFNRFVDYSLTAEEIEEGIAMNIPS